MRKGEQPKTVVDPPPGGGRNPALVGGSILAIIVVVMALFVMDEHYWSEGVVVSEDKDFNEYVIESKKHYEVYRQWAIEENRQVFEWQLRSTKIVFWISVLVSISGIVFAFWQFVEAAQIEKSTRDVSEIEVKTQIASMTFKSKSFAALVMALSIVYLLIYVNFVYPIKVAPQFIGNVHDEAIEDSLPRPQKKV